MGGGCTVGLTPHAVINDKASRYHQQLDVRLQGMERVGSACGNDDDFQLIR
jgi:hypothetical protein